MWIMISGPYSSGAPTVEQRSGNLRRLNEAALEVFRRGHVPIIGVNLALPITQVAGPNAYEELMMPISLALATRCDAVLRLPGSSDGADAEVDWFLRQSLPVYQSLAQVPDVSSGLP